VTKQRAELSYDLPVSPTAATIAAERIAAPCSVEAVEVERHSPGPVFPVSESP
jgi:hypothetical protein